MRYMRAILLSLVALVYAGTAGAATIDVVGPTESVNPTDVIEVDIIIDTQGLNWYGFQGYVNFDPAVLSPVGGIQHLAPGMTPGYPYSSLYLYGANYFVPGEQTWFTNQSNLVTGGAPAFVGSVATLVFHVMPGAGLSSIDWTYNTGPYGGSLMMLIGGLPTDVSGSTPATNLSIHVPEPTTTMLMGLGLFGILYAGRRR